MDPDQARAYLWVSDRTLRTLSLVGLLVTVECWKLVYKFNMTTETLNCVLNRRINSSGRH